MKTLLGLLILSTIMTTNAQQPLSIPADQLIGKGAPILIGDEVQLLPEVLIAFDKMQSAARAEGIELKIVSGYRDYEKQKEIWNRKFERFTEMGLSPTEAIKQIIEYSTIPGTSRHHWGTDIDVVDENAKLEGDDLLVPRYFEEDGPFFSQKKWMDQHAESFGFYLVYTNHKDRKGFAYEPWHYSYRARSFEFLEAYKKIDWKNMIIDESLLGHHHLNESFLDQYELEQIFDINPVLK